jgi:hypothetical protein
LEHARWPGTVLQLLRLGGYGVVDILVATRININDEWGESVNQEPVVTSTAGDYYMYLSPDGLVLFSLIMIIPPTDSRLEGMVKQICG